MKFPLVLKIEKLKDKLNQGVLKIILFALIGDDITYQTAVKYAENARGNLLLSAILFHCKQITVFHIGSEEHQDIDVAILRALLKGW